MSEDIAQTMVRCIVARFRPLRIVLFGSQARGEAGKWSDVDLLVVGRCVGSASPGKILRRPSGSFR